MFEHITHSINDYRTFTEDEVKEFIGRLKTIKVAKGETILNQGEICRELSFINRGSFIQCYKDDELNEVVRNLFTQCDWVLNHSSFTSQKPSLYDIEAFEASEILTINIHDLHDLIGNFPSFFALGKILEVDDPNSNAKATPDEKYQMLIEQKPSIIKTFPLKYIASYLGMTPETLSRVRSRID